MSRFKDLSKETIRWINRIEIEFMFRMIEHYEKQKKRLRKKVGDKDRKWELISKENVKQMKRIWELKDRVAELEAKLKEAQK